MTRYYDEDGRKTLLFTEVKRAKRAKTTTGIADAEAEALNYCSTYLKATGSRKTVYACTAIGPFIECFLAQYPEGTPSGSKVAELALFDLCDMLIRGKTENFTQVDVAKSTIQSYKDAGDDNHARDIQTCFGVIRRRGEPPFASSSRPPSASSSESRSASTGSPMRGVISAGNAGH